MNVIDRFSCLAGHLGLQNQQQSIYLSAPHLGRLACRHADFPGTFLGSSRVLRAVQTHVLSSAQGLWRGLSRESAWPAYFTDLMTHNSLQYGRDIVAPFKNGCLNRAGWKQYTTTWERRIQMHFIIVDFVVSGLFLPCSPTHMQTWRDDIEHITIGTTEIQKVEIWIQPTPQQGCWESKIIVYAVKTLTSYRCC